jgi:outer membrane protein TolC
MIAPRLRAALQGLLLAACITPLSAQQPITLARAIELAQQQGLQARSALSTRESARERDHAFGAAYLPSLSINGTTPNFSRSITPVIQPDGTTIYIPLQQTQAGLTANVSQRIPWTNTTLSFSSGLSQTKITGANGFESWSSTPFVVGISQPIFRSNSQMWDRRQQSIRIESSERKYLESREDAAIAATNAFYDLYAAGANLKNAAANVAINDTLYTLNKGRYEIGKIGENDLLQSELALLRVRAALADAQLANDRAMSQFRIVVNLPPGTPVDAVVTSDVPAFDADTTEAIRWARANSSVMEDAVSTEVQADRQVSEAKWNSGAGGTINASYGYNATGGNAGDAYRSLLNSQQFSLSVSLPVWQWGAHTANVEAARADRDAARNTAQLSRAQLDLNAHFAALQLTQARTGLVIASKADTVAQKRFDVAYNRYVIGKIQIDNLYVAQSEKDQALQGYAQALRAYWLAYYQLRRLTLYDFEHAHPIRE